MPTRTQRVPLGDLPLVDFLPHPNGASGKAHGFPSPLSLPSKRGPPTPSKDRPSSPSTPKRRLRSAAVERISESSLATDELGTGRSPARRLFVNESPATPETPRAVAASTSLAPSPPLASVRNDMPAPPSRTRDPLHDCGFAIYVDPAGTAKLSSSEIDAPPIPVSHHDEENMPPCQGTPVSKTSRKLRMNNSPAIRAA